jgi:bifunctional oligoribonuclease and PAP phosphatase NrnA
MRRPADYRRVKEILERETAFFLISHVNPDGDSIGSLAAMSRLLRLLRKEQVIYLHEEPPERYRFLLEGLPLTRDLSLAQNRVVLALDASDPARLGEFQEQAAGSFLVNLDHHVSNPGYGRVSLVDAEAAATGEIIYHLARLLEADIPPEMARDLYVSISTDTGSFKYDNTTPETFRIMADLLATGFSLRDTSLKVFDEIQPAALCLLKEGLHSLETAAGGRVAMITISDAALASCGAREADVDGLVNYSINLRGVEVGLLFRAREAGEVKVGFRSKGLDVSRMAAALGGGGHAQAAGCTLPGPLTAAKARVLAEVLTTGNFGNFGDGSESC